MEPSNDQRQSRAMEAPVETGRPQPVGTGGEHTLLPYGVTLSSSTAVMRPEQTLEFLAIEQIAIHVADIRRAEAFYYDFFEMEVTLRARRLYDSWEVMPSTFDYNEGLTSGYYPEVVHMRNGALALVLINSGRSAVMAQERLGHIGLRVTPATLNAMRGVALVRNFTVAQDDRGIFRFTDPFGITWQLMAGEQTGAST